MTVWRSLSLTLRTLRCDDGGQALASAMTDTPPPLALWTTPRYSGDWWARAN